MDCPRFGKMQDMFKDIGGRTIESKLIIETKVIITLVSMVDVNVTTWSNRNVEHVFKGQKPRKNKSTIDWEIKDKLKNSMVETIQ